MNIFLSLKTFLISQFTSLRGFQQKQSYQKNLRLPKNLEFHTSMLCNCLNYSLCKKLLCNIFFKTILYVWSKMIWKRAIFNIKYNKSLDEYFLCQKKYKDERSYRITWMPYSHCRANEQYEKAYSTIFVIR